MSGSSCWWGWQAVALGLAACSGSVPTAPAPPAVASVMFRYHSPELPPAPDSDIGNSVGCVHHYAPAVGLVGSWNPDVTYRGADCQKDCTISVPGVPAGVEHAVFMYDLALCSLDPSSPPRSYRTFWANGVELTRVVDHPSGLRGAAFTVSRDGRVSP